MHCWNMFSNYSKVLRRLKTADAAAGKIGIEAVDDLLLISARFESPLESCLDFA